jgi:hypothetical protein
MTGILSAVIAKYLTKYLICRAMPPVGSKALCRIAALAC